MERGARGATMVEVLVAMLILAIGMLASSRLQTLALAEQTSSRTRVAATALLEDMAARMTANPGALAAGDYDGASTEDASTGGAGDGEGRPCRSGACSAASLAREDVAQWARLLAGGNGEPPALPPDGRGAPARGTISAPMPGSVDGVRVLALTWTEYEAGRSVERTADLFHVAP